MEHKCEDKRDFLSNNSLQMEQKNMVEGQDPRNYAFSPRFVEKAFFGDHNSILGDHGGAKFECDEQGGLSYHLGLRDSDSYGHASTSMPNSPHAESDALEYSVDINNLDDDYKYSQPPVQVMTSIGPLPFPHQIREQIPDKLVAKPILQERMINIMRTDVKNRTIELPQIRFNHKFKEVPKILIVDRIVPKLKEIVEEVEKPLYKPMVEEKVVEISKGVKYTEVPIEIPVHVPPKIVLNPVRQVVDREYETLKPVVKERIIEVPQTVIKQIPKVKTVNVPYYVSRFHEKIVEVPFKPTNFSSLPPINDTGLVDLRHLTGLQNLLRCPQTMHKTVSNLPYTEINEVKLPYEAKIDVKVLPRGVVNAAVKRFHHGQKKSIRQEVADQLSAYKNIQLPPGFTWGSGGYEGLSNQGAVGNQCSLFRNFLNTNQQSIFPGIPQFQRFNGLSPLNYIKNTKYPYVNNIFGTILHRCEGDLKKGSSDCDISPIAVTCPPEVGTVSASNGIDDDNIEILTRFGVISYKGFKNYGQIDILCPEVDQSIPNAKFPQSAHNLNGMVNLGIVGQSMQCDTISGSQT